MYVQNVLNSSVNRRDNERNTIPVGKSKMTYERGVDDAPDHLDVVATAHRLTMKSSAVGLFPHGHTRTTAFDEVD